MTEYGPTWFIINEDWAAVLICPNCEQPVGLGKTLYVLEPEIHWSHKRDSGTVESYGTFSCEGTW